MAGPPRRYQPPPRPSRDLERSRQRSRQRSRPGQHQFRRSPPRFRGMSAGPAYHHKMGENPQYGEIYNSNSSIALACKLPMPGGIRGAVPRGGTHPTAAQAASNAPWEPCCGPADHDQRRARGTLSKRVKIRTPYVGQAAGTWFSRAHALLKNRNTGARQICFLAAEVTTDQVRGILSPDKTECGSHVSSGRAAASPLRSPAFRDTTRQRFAG